MADNQIPMGKEMDVRDHPDNTDHNSNLSFGERVSRFLSGGRDLGQRAFYNATRAGLLNPNTPPDDASPMGGLGTSLKNRRIDQAYQSQEIENLFRKKSNGK